MFDSVAVAVCFMLKSETVAVEGGLEPGCAVDEKQGVCDIVFLTQFAEKYLGQCGCTARIQLCVEDVVRFGIDSGVQPELLVVDLNNSFVQRHLSRSRPASGPEIGFLDPVVDRFSAAFAPEFSSSATVFETDNQAKCRRIPSSISRGGVRSLHKRQIDPLTSTTEAGDFWHRTRRNSAASLFTHN